MSASPAKTRRRIPLWVRIVFAVGVLAASIWFVVLPQLGSAESALRSLQQPPVPFLVVAAALEGSSNAAYSALTARLMGRNRLSYFTALRIDATDLGVNHVVPGGGATAAALRFQLFVRQGIPASEALSGATVEITISNLALGVLFGLGLAISLTALGSSSFYVLALAAVAALILVAALTGWLLDRRLDWCIRIARWVGRRIRRIGERRAETFVRSIARRVHDLTHEPRRLWLTIGFALGNWVLDVSSLWMMFVAFGYAPPIGPLLAVYGLGSILAMLPLTPGGLGLVEGVMVPAFAALGVPVGVALLAVIAWRVLEYWLPIPVGALAYGSLRFSDRHSTGTFGTVAQRERV